MNVSECMLMFDCMFCSVFIVVVLALAGLQVYNFAAIKFKLSFTTTTTPVVSRTRTCKITYRPKINSDTLLKGMNESINYC